MCELNDSCYDTSINNNYDEIFLKKFKRFALNVTDRLEGFQNKINSAYATTDVWANLIRILKEKNLFSLQILGMLTFRFNLLKKT
jgi:hypothetical protein